MDIKEYSENITLKYSETDQNLSMKPYALLNFLQDIASKNAEDNGFGYSFIHKKNYAWFLIKYRMEFSDYPFDIQNLTLKTKPRGYNKLFAYRNFELLKENKSIAKISSMWSIVDVNTRSMMPIGEALENNPKMPIFKKEEEDLSFVKISPFDNFDIEKQFEVRYNDLDVNSHANNGNYIVWAFETLDFEFKNSHKIKTLDMIYKKEVKYGEIITSKLKFKDGNTSIHRLQNNSCEDVCYVQCEWENI